MKGKGETEGHQGFALRRVGREEGIGEGGENRRQGFAPRCA